MMWSPKSVANAVGGKTARACDSCVRKRARWYCAADDAFLCQSCDSAVHSANSLARRHQRLRLNSNSKPCSSSPSWLAGFTRKPRTPRPHPTTTPRPNPASFSLVPDPDADATTSPDPDHDQEDRLLYTVPTFDPFQLQLGRGNNHNQSKQLLQHGFVPSADLDLDEFAADVESLLGRNLETECCFIDMEGLGMGMGLGLDRLVDCNQQDDTAGRSRSVVKVENQDDAKQEEAASTVPHQLEAEVDLMRDPAFEFNFEDYDVGVKNEKTSGINDDYVKEEDESYTNKKKKTKLALRLDCDAVIAAWGNVKSPWTTGERPDFHPDDAWPHSMANCGVNYGHACGDQFGMAAAAVGAGGREARVSRYREKRRTRLFSKKIRYEVRKLNAEKRPRMKGRFVKRTPFAPPTLPIISIK